MRTGVEIVDRLNIVCHDKFQEIVDEANKPKSQIRSMRQIFLTDEDLQQKTQTVISRSQLTPSH